MHNRVTGLGSIFLVSAVIGCGGSSGKPTNLPPTTKLMALTPAQQTQILQRLLELFAPQHLDGQLLQVRRYRDGGRRARV